MAGYDEFQRFKNFEIMDSESLVWRQIMFVYN